MVATVETGGKPFALAMSPDGRRALIANETGPSLGVIDVDTGALTPLTLEGLALALPLGGLATAVGGGPAFATHAAGIATVDLQSNPPRITGSIASQKPYGACAAVQAGKVLYAIDTGSGHVDCIDIMASAFGLVVVATVDTGGGAMDLAASPDGKWLCVLDKKGSVLARLDCATNTLVAPAQPIDPASRSVAVRQVAANSEAYVARDGGLRRIGEGGAVADFGLTADARDAGFTTGGDLLYVASGKSDELAVFRANTMMEVARLKVGDEPVAVAVVPQRRRALVANAAGGTVSIVDVVPRQRLCEALSRPCDGGERCPCVTLATIELLPNGTIGVIDNCRHRRVVYSNAVLFEMILCLADRIEECCTGESVPPPEPPPPPPPPPVTTFRVTAVDFRSRQNQVQAELDPNRADVPPEIPAREGGVSVIRVAFNHDVDLATVTAATNASDLPNASFQVRGAGRVVPIGAIQSDPAPNAVRFILRDNEMPAFRPGRYTVALFGDPPAQGRRAIADVRGERLDGDTNVALPSGDNTAGGVFKFSFIIND